MSGVRGGIKMKRLPARLQSLRESSGNTLQPHAVQFPNLAQGTSLRDSAGSGKEHIQLYLHG